MIDRHQIDLGQQCYYITPKSGSACQLLFNVIDNLGYKINK